MPPISDPRRADPGWSCNIPSCAFVSWPKVSWDSARWPAFGSSLRAFQFFAGYSWNSALRAPTMRKTTLPMPFKRVQNIGTSRVWSIMLSSDLHGCQWHWLDQSLAVKNTPNTRLSRWKLQGMLWLGWVMQMPNMIVVPMDRQSQTASWRDGSLCHGCTSSDFEPVLCKMTTWWHHVALIWTTIDLLCNQYQLRKQKRNDATKHPRREGKKAWGLDCQSFPFHSYAVPIGLLFHAPFIHIHFLSFHVRSFKKWLIKGY